MKITELAVYTYDQNANIVLYHSLYQPTLPLNNLIRCLRTKKFREILMSKNFHVILHPQQNIAKIFCKLFEKLP